MEMQDLNPDTIPRGALETIFLSLSNKSIDLKSPHIRPYIESTYPVFVLLYAITLLVGGASNICVIIHVLCNKLNVDATYGFILNLAVTNILECIFVLPMSLMRLLVQNWIFGKILCYILPMIQGLPNHVTILCYLLIIIDRYRFLLDSRNRRLSSFIFSGLIWLIGICVVLPQFLYIEYIDLEAYLGRQLEGVSMCMVNLDNAANYVRVTFALMYVLPLIVISFLHVKAKEKLYHQERIMEVRSHAPSSCCTGNINCFFRVKQVEIGHEKRTQKYIWYMVVMFAVCVCPLAILSIMKPFLIETYENSGKMDVIYIMLVWVVLLPTCSTPFIYNMWRKDGVTEQRLRNSSRGRNHNLARSEPHQPADNEVGN